MHFRFKRITFATVTPIVYTTPAFSRSKTETFENAADPVLDISDISDIYQISLCLFIVIFSHYYDQFDCLIMRLYWKL